MYSPDTTKYLIHLHLSTEGVVEKSDVVGAIFGQTEGLLGDDLDLRDLQRTGRVGRIDVQIISHHGNTSGEVYISSSIDKAETALLAASLETIERVGPCVSEVRVDRIEDIRVSKRKQIVERAKSLLIESFDESSIDTAELLDAVREQARIGKIGEYGPDNLPAGPHVESSDAIIVVEGRADVVNLLRFGIKNTVAVEGTNVPDSVAALCAVKTTTLFVDGDRGGDLIISELMQKADIDYIALSPRNRSVEDMSRKEIVKALRNKIPSEFWNGPKNVNAPEKLPEKEEENMPEDYLELKDHMDAVRGHSSARLLNESYETVRECDNNLIEELLERTSKEVAGIVTDRGCDQKFVDILVKNGVSFVASPDFAGILKKPVELKLLKIA